jgi:hypothetical protein
MTEVELPMVGNTPTGPSISPDLAGRPATKPTDAAIDQARREANKQRAKEWRDRKRQQADPAAVALAAAQKAQADAAAKAKAEAEARAATEARQKMEAQLKDVLTAAFEGGASIIQSSFFDPTRPKFGRERAAMLGEVWSPVLLPYVAAYLQANPQLIVASVATIAAIGAWAGEYHAGQPARVAA